MALGPATKAHPAHRAIPAGSAHQVVLVHGTLEPRRSVADGQRFFHLSADHDGERAIDDIDMTEDNALLFKPRQFQA